MRIAPGVFVAWASDVQLLIVVNVALLRDTHSRNGHLPFVVSVTGQHDMSIRGPYSYAVCLDRPSRHWTASAGSVEMIKHLGVFDAPWIARLFVICKSEDDESTVSASLNA